MIWHDPYCVSAVPQSGKPICPKCRRAMRFALVKELGGRQFKCLDCDGEDPLRSTDVTKLLNSELQPPRVAAMAPPATTTDLHDWDARAEEALEAARKLPCGPQRSEALKQAGQLRVAADVKGFLLARRGGPLK
jgi:hypothetical protein